MVKCAKCGFDKDKLITVLETVEPVDTVVAVDSWAFGVGSGNAGLTISKLIEAAMFLDAAEGDEDEERYISLPALKIGDLLSTTEVTDVNYNTVRALVDGKIDVFMGFKFIPAPRVKKNTLGQYRIMAWRKSALALHKVVGAAKVVEIICT